MWWLLLYARQGGWVARFALILIFIFFAAVGHATTTRELFSDAEANRYYGDFYKSYRDYGVIEKLKPELFGKLGLDGYLASLFVVGGSRDISAECGRLSTVKKEAAASQAAYICGLHYVELKKTTEAEGLLKGISERSHFFWPAQILRATAQIIANRPQVAIQLLNLRQLKQYAKYDLTDNFNLTLARAYALQNNLEEALKYYQAIAGESPSYISALEETGWIFFKMRRFESAAVLLDVLIAQYESAQHLNLDQKISSFAYFRSKYLKAYMALIEKRTEGASGDFADLKTEYEEAVQIFHDALDGEEVLRSIQTQNEKWTDVHSFPDHLNEQLLLISEWLGADSRLQFEKDIYFQMALSREVSRVKAHREVIAKADPTYEKGILDLQAKSWSFFASRYLSAMKKVEKELNTMKIKAELWRMEIVWMKRAEGARSLDEVVDSYRQESSSFNEYFER